VVDSESNQLYGHVVASDVFRVSYIVPASDVFRDIQLRLSLKAVKLPVRLPPSILPIFEAQVPSTNGLSQDQVSKTLLNALTAVAFHQNILEESRSEHQLSGGGGLPAEAEDQAIVRHKKLSNRASHNDSLESSKVKMAVSAFDEPQQHKADNKPETRHILPLIENPYSISWPPISVPEATHIYPPRQTLIEPDDSMQRQGIPRKPVTVHEATTFGPNKINVVPELPAPFKHDASSSTKFGMVTDPLDRPIASGATTFEVPRIPIVVTEHVVSSVTQRFSDSGYSTMANTPAGSKRPSQRSSPFYEEN
jgi:hypothetical protein